MSERTQESREDDLLEQVFTQGLEKMNAPTRTADTGETPGDETHPAPRREDGEESPNPANRKSRRSSVYLYLLVLFGAAFLMLLLAYFIQLRRSEDTFSDLRSSMNLSRQDLLDQINALEEQNAMLEEQNNALNNLVSNLYRAQTLWQERYEEQVRDENDFSIQLHAAQAELFSWKLFWALEQSYQAEEYEDCVAILLLGSMSEYGGGYIPKEIDDRFEEIVRALIDRGLFTEDLEIPTSDVQYYQDLIYYYLVRHPEFGPLTGWANAYR